MLKAKQFTLRFNKEACIWLLENNKSSRIIKKFPTKDLATKTGVLKKAIGGQGSVIIRGQNGVYIEERFFKK